MKNNRHFVTVLIAIISTLITIFVYSKFTEKNNKLTNKNKITSFKDYKIKEDINPISANSKKQYYNNVSKHIDFTHAAEKTIHAVVHVKTKYIRKSNPIYNFFYGQGNGHSREYLSSGSGVIISADGYIVTNNHVVENSAEINVVLNDKRSYKAKIIGSDPSTDLAVLKINEKNLPFISLGNSDNLKIGEWVLAVGNPFNLTSTVTAGIVSAKARNINILRDEKFPIESFIQTDAAVNPGNSGGALVNLKGELIGINSAIASQTGSYTGYSFAIPVSIVSKTVSDILKYGKVQRAILGISIANIDSESAKQYSLNKIEGVYIRSVVQDGAAYRAGIKQGDVILKINNNKVNSMAQLQEQISKYRPGENINIEIKRNNKRKQFNVVLRNMLGSTSIIKPDEVFSSLGASFKNLNDNLAKKVGIKNGVLVTEINTKGAISKAGINKGFIITHIQDEEIKNLDHFKNIIENSKEKSSIEIIGIYPRNRNIYVYRLKL
ncbi:MAG: Do family serine endopeptidase [Bacteroidota bacterium]|nr:Do family serine endopeptidase [Bacteroidota bacterium]